MKFSYFSVILFFWSILLCIRSSQTDPLLGIVSTLSAALVLLLSMDDERLVMPLLFMSQLCFDKGAHRNHVIACFFSSTFFSWSSVLSTVKPKRLISFSWIILYTFAGVIFLLYWNTGGLLLHSLIYISFSHGFNGFLAPLLGGREACITSSILGFLFDDAFTGLKTARIDATAQKSGVLVISIGEAFLCCAAISGIALPFAKWIAYHFFSRSRRAQGVASFSDYLLPEAAVTSLVFLPFALLFVYYYLGANINIISYVINYIFDTEGCLLSLFIWIITIPCCVVAIHFWTTRVPNIIRRKLFHILGVFAFLYPAIAAPFFLSLSINLVAAVFVLIEVGRANCPRQFAALSNLMEGHIDSRETIHGVVRSHMYLLFGMGLSILIAHHDGDLKFSNAESHALCLIPGIISLGVVDTVAAACGSRYGGGKKLSYYFRNRFFTDVQNPAMNHKTVVGTCCGGAAGLLFWLVVEWCIGGTTWNCLPLGLSIVMSSIFECTADGIDNLHLPILTLSALYTQMSCRI